MQASTLKGSQAGSTVDVTVENAVGGSDVCVGLTLVGRTVGVTTVGTFVQAERKRTKTHFRKTHFRVRQRRRGAVATLAGEIVRRILRFNGYTRVHG